MESGNLSVLTLVKFIKNARVEDSQNLLSSLLTPSEIDALAQRLDILDGLANGTPQREISETLGVGIATVTRGSRVWQKEKQLLQGYFPRAKKFT
ncbi:MAG: Trp family transcriptional regulator [Silvanigrellaceae bacterium]